MATAAVSVPTLDLKQPASYPVRIGASIRKPDASSRYSSVRYNYKPEGGDTKGTNCMIKPGKGAGESILSIKDGDEEYRYEGQYGETADGYVLVIQGDGGERHAVLEKLSSVHAYNLLSDKPDEYPQISLDEDGDDLFGDDDEEEPLDPNNPFDFRHFLKPATEKPRAQQNDSTQSTTGTPLTQARPASSTPVARPTKRADTALLPNKKRKAQASAEKPDSKRVRADHEAPTTTQKETSKPQPKVEAPKIRVDRKASLRRPSYDDLGELILENETPVTEKLPPGRSAMSLALGGQLGGGPISLRSAASSPGSRVASPMPSRPAEMEEEGEIEIGGESPAGMAKADRRPPPQADEDGDADEEDEDADVEDLELPSPAAVHKPSVSAATVTPGDEEDDLDKQLALAMAEEDEGGSAAMPVEDEEESEEE